MKNDRITAIKRCRKFVPACVYPVMKVVEKRMRILYLPLDSRPCNNVFPAQMARWAGAECVIPPPEIMDRFTVPSNGKAICDFLESHFAEADALVVSVDQLCFGGLLASREAAVSLPEALSRLELLGRLHGKCPEKPIHAFSVIIRSTISTLRLSDYETYLAVTAYSESSDRYTVMRNEADRVRMEEAEAKIPPEVLQRIRDVRRRNHRVNLRCLEWRREGVLTSLSLLMEDSQPYGFHRREQRILMQRMEGVSDTFLHNGTDEGGCVSMAKALTREQIPVAVRWVGREDGRFIARFEDRPFIQNLRDHMVYLGLREDPGANTVLVIAAPPDGRQGDFHEQQEDPYDDAVIGEMAEEINRLIRENKKVYLLDILCANGGSPKLLYAVNAPGLAGYSAWNTATNAMGTILAQTVTDFLAGRPNLPFRNERFMDDMIYESLLRYPLDRELIAEGRDPYNLSDPRAVEQIINERFHQLASEPACAGIFEAIRAVGPGRMTLPWPRTFEVQAHNDG